MFYIERCEERRRSKKINSFRNILEQLKDPQKVYCSENLNFTLYFGMQLHKKLPNYSHLQGKTRGKIIIKLSLNSNMKIHTIALFYTKFILILSCSDEILGNYYMLFFILSAQCNCERN